eukprot:297513-Amphidinium_carterae.2
MGCTVHDAINLLPGAEDISIKFSPEHNANDAQEAATFNMRRTMGVPLGVWNNENGQRIDNDAPATLWLGLSISAWSMTDTQWHLNEFSAISMLNTRSMSNAFRGWCEQNNLTTVLNKYLEANGTIKQQYVVADNGVEHNHDQAMALDKWHRDNHMVLSNQQMTMRASTMRAMARSCSGQAR